jgi:hypothetical protein
MTRNLMNWIATPAVLAVMVSAASAQNITDEHVQELIRQAALRVGATAQGTAPSRRAGRRQTATLSLTRRCSQAGAR